MPRNVLLLSCLFTVAPLAAQGRAVVPPPAATLPGNAAMSLPLRWSQGVLQICMAPDVLPTNFVGQTIRGIRLRRPTLLGEPAYAALQRTLTVRACFAAIDPTVLGGGLIANRPANLQVVAGPAAFSVAASAPPTGGQSLGAEFLVVPFATPLPVVAGSLFLEIESGDAPMTIAEQWVDAVWIRDGIDRGYTAAVGDGSCTLATTPLELRWTGTFPQRGTDAQFRLTGAVPGALVYAWAGIEPESHAAAPFWFGYGGSLAPLAPSLANCFQWAPLDVVFTGVADAGGNYSLTFPIPISGTQPMMRVGVQSAYVDFNRSGFPASFSNGQMLVLDGVRIHNRCSSVFFPGPVTTSPFGVMFGLMPVLILDL